MAIEDPRRPTSTPPRPRRRRPATRGLLFGAPLDRLPPAGPTSDGRFGASPRDQPVPVALIGVTSRVAPPRVTGFGSMAASWPLVDRHGPSALAGRGAERLGELSGAERDRMLGR